MYGCRHTGCGCICSLTRTTLQQYRTLNRCAANSLRFAVQVCSCRHLLLHSTALAVERAVDVQDQHLRKQHVLRLLDLGYVMCMDTSSTSLGIQDVDYCYSESLREENNAAGTHMRTACRRQREPHHCAKHRQDTSSHIRCAAELRQVEQQQADRNGQLQQQQQQLLNTACSPHPPAQKDLLPSFPQPRFLLLLSIPGASRQERRSSCRCHPSH